MIVISIFVLSMMLFSTFFNFGSWVEYEVNLVEYKELCENKAQPELKCDGKCHLKTMFKEEVKENNSNNIPEPILKLSSETFVFFEEKVEQKTEFVSKLFHSNLYYFFSIIENENFDLFVPPKI